MSFFRTSFKLDEEDNTPLGVIEGISLEDMIKPNLLEIEGIDKTKITEEGELWIVDDMDYFEELNNHLSSLGKLESKSPYSNYLNKPLPTYDTDDCEDLIDWSELPSTTTPFDYQFEAFYTAVLNHEGRSLVALKTGSGKTLVGVLFMYYYIEVLQKGGHALVICPASKTLDWIRDYAKWTGKSTKNIYSMTFESASRRAVDTPDFFKKFDVIVVDECHHLKNRNTEMSKNLTPIIHETPAVLLLSGTPQLNRNSELYNQFHLIHPDIFDDHKVFTQRFSAGFTNRSGQWDERGADFLWELNFLAKKVMYRKDIVTTIATKTRHRIYSVPTKDQMMEQHKMSKARTVLNWKIAAANEASVRMSLERKRDNLITKMQRSAGIWKSTNAIQEIKNIIDKHPGQKIAFFGELIKVTKAVKAAVDAMGYEGESVILTGSSSKKLRQYYVDKMADPNDSLRFGFFTRCMREGVTMSPGTTVAVMLEIGWVPSDMQQKENRIYRVGTTEPVNVYWLFCLGSYDDEAYEKILHKASEIKDVTGDDLDFKFDTEIKPDMPVYEIEKKPKRSKKRKASKDVELLPLPKEQKLESPLLVPMDEPILVPVDITL
jgi:SNF2 family DNA or RNA helicase